MGGGRRGKRGLAPEELRLWQKVAATADPLTPESGRGRPETSPPADSDPPEIAAVARRASSMPRVPPSPADPNPSFRPTPSLKPRRAPSISFDPRPAEARPVGRPEAGLDRRTAERLRKGARDPDGRIDLHGMTAERAHRACLGFISDSLRRGHRMVLVITGKGRDPDRWTGEGRGVIRSALPGWLKASPLWSEIVAVYQAHQRHGGAGAVYVYLKRRR